MTDTIIKNATWAISGEKYDLSLTTCEDGKHPQLDGITLTGVERCEPAGKLPVPQGAQVIDAAGKLLLPALFDMHAKVEISGRSKRESVNRTGQAATNGGVWAMLVMPTRGFCFDSAPNLDSFRDAVEQRSSAEMYAAGCITLGMGGEQQAPYNTLAARGVRILSDAEHVPANLLTLHRVMKYVAELDMVLAIRGDVPELTRNTYMHPGATSYRLGLHGTPACAEEIGIETLLRLAADAGARIHIQTVSTAEGVDIIRRAKAAGQKVTAEVALHHLLFTHEDVGNYDTNYKVLPPLRERRDCEALIVRAKSSAVMAKRGVLLETRSEMVDEAYRRAAKQIRDLPSEQYFELLTIMLKGSLQRQLAGEAESMRLYGEDIAPAGYDIMLNSRDMKHYGDNLLRTAREVLCAKLGLAPSRVTLAAEPADIDGGLILRCGDVEVNCSLSMLFAEVRRTTEQEVSDTLFGKKA